MALKRARLNRGLSVDDVAEELGINPSSYRYYERTGGMPRDPKVAKRIADFFKVRVSDLWLIERDASKAEDRAA